MPRLKIRELTRRLRDPVSEDDQLLRLGTYLMVLEAAVIVAVLLIAFGWGFSLLLLGAVIFLALVEFLRRRYARGQ